MTRKSPTKAEDKKKFMKGLNTSLLAGTAAMVTAAANAALPYAGGMAGVFAAAAALGDSRVNMPNLFHDFPKQTGEAMLKSANAVAKHFLETAPFTQEQRDAAQEYLPPRMIARYIESAAKTSMRDIIAALAEDAGFIQLMTSHTDAGRAQQAVSRGHEVADVLKGGTRTQSKAPPRASFTRKRNTVTA